MKGKYKAAFLIPIGANKVLGEDGWEFESSNRLSSEVKEFLISALKLKFSESYLGVDSYVDENIKMSVFHDDQNQIESIHFQIHGDAMTALSDVFLTSPIAYKSEFFIPRES